MKFKPLEKPVMVGCANCSPVPTNTLDLGEKVDFDCMYGLIGAKVYIEEHEYNYYFDNSKPEITLRELVKEFKKDIEICDSFCIEFTTALHGEIYEFNKEDYLFYLIEQTMGWA
jgi:hypothetical protein